jgi:arginyl-tRNA--protein-N-Asp/Glu arginylyltransferase
MRTRLKSNEYYKLFRRPSSKMETGISHAKMTMSMYTQLVRLKSYPQPTQSFRQYVSAVPLQAQLSAQTLLWFNDGSSLSTVQPL